MNTRVVTISNQFKTSIIKNTCSFEILVAFLYIKKNDRHQYLKL